MYYPENISSIFWLDSMGLNVIKLYELSYELGSPEGTLYIEEQELLQHPKEKQSCQITGNLMVSLPGFMNVDEPQIIIEYAHGFVDLEKAKLIQHHIIPFSLIFPKGKIVLDFGQVNRALEIVGVLLGDREIIRNLLSEIIPKIKYLGFFEVVEWAYYDKPVGTKKEQLIFLGTRKQGKEMDNDSTNKDTPTN